MLLKCLLFTDFRYIHGRRTDPILDSQSDVRDVYLAYEDGIYMFNFTRSRQTGDSDDNAFSDEEAGCYYLLYPYVGIPVSATGGLAYHVDGKPRVTRTKICIPLDGIHDELTVVLLK